MKTNLMHKQVFLLITSFLIFSSPQIVNAQEILNLGTHLKNIQDQLLFDNSNINFKCTVRNEFIPAKQILHKGIKYTIGLSKEGYIVYIETNDPNFLFNNRKIIGKDFREFANGNKIKKYPGWVEFIPLDNDWYAAIHNGKIWQVFRYIF